MDFGAFVFGHALAREDLDVDDGPLDSRRRHQRRVAHFPGLFTEDGAQQFLFRGKLRFPFGSDLADQNIAGSHLGADADDAAFVEVAQRGVADIGDVARDFFRPEFGVTSFDLQLFDVDRGVAVFLDQLFADQDRVFEVVSAPGHESYQHIAAESKFALIRAGAVRQHLSS